MTHKLVHSVKPFTALEQGLRRGGIIGVATARKDVMVVIELRARFDEAANIELAAALVRVLLRRCRS